jgi:protein O-mannosyl-transferase
LIFDPMVATRSERRKSRDRRRHHGAERPALRQTYPSRNVWLVVLSLVALAFVAYSPVWRFDFVSIDDPQYVSQNPHVAGGLSWTAVQWAFTTGHQANWHPLTWVSHMIDVQLFGLDAGAHHFLNLLFHAANAVLLFLLLRRMTGAHGRSAFVAALFAVHPLHVESVAWVAERKDLLSGLVFMLTIWAYVGYVRRPDWRRYLGVVVLYAAGLMAKPMLVTLPFVLLLLDWWPLGRFKNGAMRQWGNGAMRFVVEKLPLFALAAISSIVTFLVQREGGAVRSTEAFPLGLRVANAIVSAVRYLTDLLWPAKLGIFYPFPNEIGLTSVLIALGVLVAISILAMLAARRAPVVPVGWLWYLGMLVPVIGLVQVGTQARADRYTYLPIIGMLMIVAWSASDVAARWSRARRLLPIAAAAIVAASAVATHAQVQHWKDTSTLWSHTARVTDDSNNFGVHYALAEYLRDRGSLPDAIAHYDTAIRRNPAYVEAYLGLGRALAAAGQVDRAAAVLVDATRLKPDYVDAHATLAVLFTELRRTEEAARAYGEVVRLRPDVGEGHHQLALTLATLGRMSEAMPHFAEAVRLDPQSGSAHNDYGLALERAGRRAEAHREYVAAIRLQPDLPEAHNNLGSLLASEGDLPAALREFEGAVRLAPAYTQAHMNLGIALARLKRTDEALREFREVLRVDPANEPAKAAIAALTKVPRA